MANLQRRGGSKWPRVQWRNGTTGKLRTRTLTGISDPDLAREAARRIAGEAALVRHGLADPAEKRYRTEGARAIAEHIDHWRDLIAGNSRNYAKEESRLVERVMDAAGVHCLGDIRPGDVRLAIDRMRKTVSGDLVSVRTKNKALTACKMFCEQLRRDGALKVNPVADVKGWAQVDPKHAHVALTDDELAAVIHAAEKSHVKIEGLTGTARAMLYRTAAGTGFRRRTLLALKPADLYPLGEFPYIAVGAGNMKNRRAKEQPITQSLAAALALYCTGRNARLPIFRPNRDADTAKMMKHDVEAAGLLYEPSPGRFRDFHGLRASYITAICRNPRGGLKIAQELAGHSTPTLTAKYAQPTMVDERAALAGLPEIPAATATDEKNTRSLRRA